MTTLLVKSAGSRFDTLFGMRRADVGPAGLYNAFGRANFISPNLRVEATQQSNWRGTAPVRAATVRSEQILWNEWRWKQSKRNSPLICEPSNEVEAESMVQFNQSACCSRTRSDNSVRLLTPSFS